MQSKEIFEACNQINNYE